MHQKPSTPGTFYTKHLLHQPPCPPDNFTPDKFCAKQFLHRNLLHQASSATDTFYTRHVFDSTHHLWHQTTFAPKLWLTYPLPILLYTTASNTQILRQATFTPDILHTRQLLRHRPFYILHQTPSTLHTKQFSHQKPFTPKNFYTRNVRRQVHQTTFTQETLDTRQRMKTCTPTTFTPNTFHTRNFQNQTICTPRPGKPKSRVSFFLQKIGKSIFHWFASSGPNIPAKPKCRVQCFSQKLPTSLPLQSLLPCYFDKISSTIVSVFLINVHPLLSPPPTNEKLPCFLM